MSKKTGFKKGSVPWNKGLRGYRAGVPHPWNRIYGSKHWSFKGSNVGYRGLHLWVESVLGKPSRCESCGKIASGHGMHWANVSGKYLRVVSDWIRLCPKCHRDFDYNRITT